MPKINVLDSSIYNRISAGEVVERPASVVKELVENALDAKATSVVIEIENGGTKLIKVTDNGCGIDYDDLQKAFLPHATSKINSIDDLEGILTLGFRGEALASIASVSRVELISKTKDSDVGGKIKISGGALDGISEIGCADGTSIFVKDLFFNTPARLKFLKSNKQEEGAITNIVNRLILANPDISFKYVIDGKIIYNASLSGLKEKIYVVYGKQTVENLIEVNAIRGDYSLKGYISKPTFCKANKTYQTLVINNRYVQNNLVGVAISNAYENFLMKGKFPFFVLSLGVNHEDIDVNVHPSKMEVKFKNTNEIYNLFYSVVLETLNNNNCPAVFDDYNFTKNDVMTPNKEIAPDTTLQKVEGGFSFSDFNKFNDEVKNISVVSASYVKDDISTLKSSNYELGETTLNNKPFTNEELAKININDIVTGYDKHAYLSNTKSKQQSFINPLDYKLIGTLFNTYIVVESDGCVFIIDQHAGHERVLYDTFINQFEENKVINQQLLVPYSFSVNEIEKDLIESNKKVFKNLGFEVEEFGYLTYKIVSIPSVLDGINLEEFVLDILKDTNKVSNNSNQIKDYFAKCACKAAVKGGQRLSDNEITFLLNKIIENKTTLLCPHGRPICIKLSKQDIEKMFKRIV